MSRLNALILRLRRALPTLAVTLLYCGLAVVMTWPLAAGLGHDLASDLADPLLNCWIMAWDIEHLKAFAGGDLHALDAMWNANIFYPQPYTLAYSEHLVAQAVQAAPIYLLTGNIILNYNILFLGTFVLSALGAYLFARDLFDDRLAAFLAGVLYGFAHYRLDQAPHLQVMSSQWMPFALLGMRRFIHTRRVIYLAGTIVALAAQGLSCGYFLFFFSPFVALYALWELYATRQMRDTRLWLSLAAAALAVVLLCLPFIVPYAMLREIEPLTQRDRSTVDAGSADVFGYLTAGFRLHFWGKVLRLYPRGEGALFPGSIPLLLLAAALTAAFVRAWRRGRASGSFAAGSPWKKRALLVLTGALAIHALAVIFIVFGDGIFLNLGLFDLRLRDLDRTLVIGALIIVAMAALSQRVRVMLAPAARSTLLFLLLAALLAQSLSLGITPRARGSELSAFAPYRILYEYVPGFDGLRVPARYSMVFLLFLSVLGAYAARSLFTRRRRASAWIAALSLVFLAESAGMPLDMNSTWGNDDVKRAPQLTVGADAPPVYAYLRGLPKGSVILELPIGIVTWETRHMYYSTYHWHPLVNGYSGFFPMRYLELQTALRRIMKQPDNAYLAVLQSGATHIVIHQGAWKVHQGPRIAARLIARGLKPMAEFGDDLVLVVPRTRGASTTPSR